MTEARGTAAQGEAPPFRVRLPFPPLPPVAATALTFQAVASFTETTGSWKLTERTVFALYPLSLSLM